MVYRSYEPPSRVSRVEQVAQTQKRVEPEARAGLRAPVDISVAIQPLYQELHLVGRELRRGTRSRKARARDTALVDALDRLDVALRAFNSGVDWAALRRSPETGRRAAEILLAPTDALDDRRFERIGALLDVDAATRSRLRRDFEAAVADLAPVRSDADVLEQLHSHLTALSTEVAEARRSAHRTVAGRATATAEQRSLWRALITRVGKALAIFALVLGLASDSYALDDIARTGVAVWHSVTEAVHAPGMPPRDPP